jgi:putative colanic acid biosynthesis glycosyltransferase
MRIVQINVVYNEGSTGKIVHDLHSSMIDNGNESYVLYGRGKKVHGDPLVLKIASEAESKLQALYSRITGWSYSGAWFSTKRMIKAIKKISPDIVHLHILNGNFVNIYTLLKFLKENEYHTVLTLHAELMYTGKCGHAYDCERWRSGCGECPQKYDPPISWFFDRTAFEWGIKKNIYSDFSKLSIVAVSPWLKERARQSPFFTDKEIFIIGNGINTVDTFHPVDATPLRKKLGLTDETILLYVTPWFKDKKKGASHLVELAEKVIITKNFKIVLIGYTGKEVDLPSNVIPISKISDQRQLAQYYSLANLTLLLSKKETFSMVCVESLSCGTPVVGFKAGAPEQISLKKYSEFIEYGDLFALQDSINRWIDKKKLLGSSISDEASLTYSKDKMYNNYYNLYLSLLNR